MFDPQPVQPEVLPETAPTTTPSTVPDDDPWNVPSPKVDPEPKADKNGN